MAQDVKVVKTVFVVDDKDVVKTQKDFEQLASSVDKASLSVSNLSNSIEKQNAKITESKTKMLSLQKSHEEITKKIKEQGDADGSLRKEQERLNKEFEKASQRFKDATLSAENYKRQLADSTKSVEKLNTSVSGIGSVVAGAFAVGSIISFGKAILDATKDNETFIMSLSAMLKSKEQANVLNAQIIELAKKTPFSLVEMQQSTRSLIAMGVVSTDIKKTLTTLSDVAAGTGNSITELAEKFGRFKTQGRLYQQDVNELTGRGIPVIEEFAKQFGVAEGEVRKLIEAGKIGFPEVQKALEDMTAEGGKFFELSEQLATTTTGQLSAMGDSWNQLLVKIGNSSSGIINNTIKVVNNTLDGIKTIWSAFDNALEGSANVNMNPIAENAKTSFENAIEYAKKYNKDVKAEVELTRNSIQELNNYAIKAQEERIKAFQSFVSEKFGTDTKIEDLKQSPIGAQTDNKFQKKGETLYDVAVKELTKLNELKSTTSIINEQYTAILKEVDKVENEIANNKKEREKAELKRIKEKEKQFKLELDLLHAEERRALQVSKNAKENTLKQIAIEQDFNEKRIGIYTKYNAYLQKQDKSAKQDLIINTRTLGVKRYDEEIAQLKAYQDKVKSMLEKNEKDVRSRNLSESNIEQSKINIEKYGKLKALYENDKISFEDMLKEKDRIELEYKEKSLEANKVYLEKRLLDEKLTTEEEFKIKEELAKNEIELNEEKNKKKLEQDKKYAEDNRQITKALGQFAKEAVDTYYTYRSRVLGAELDESQRNKESELAKVEETENGKAKVYTKAEMQKKAIEEKYRIEQANIKRQQFELQKQQALTEIAINTAVAVAKVWSQTGVAGIVAQIAPIAMGALQAGLVLSQPTPKFAKGGKINGKKHSQGGEIVEVEHDEWIINANASNKYNGLLKAINDGSLERKGITPELANKLLNSGMSSPIVNINNDNLAKELRAMPKNAISIDENGFKHYIVSENSKIQSLNKRYGV